MTHQTDPELLNNVLQLLTEQGHDGFAEGLRLLVNEAMRVRNASQSSKPNPTNAPTPAWATPTASNPKPSPAASAPSPFASRRSAAKLDFYPSALEKGIRSEQALKLAMAEMYVQGVSTRKVSAIVEELCGTSVSSAQVSQCAKLLDAELQKWRDRPLGAYPYLMFDARYEKVRHDGQLLDCAVLIALGIAPTANAPCWASASPSVKPKCIGAPSSKACCTARPHGVSVHRQRRPPRHGGRPQSRLPRRAVATLPVPSPAKRPGLCAPARISAPKSPRPSAACSTAPDRAAAETRLKEIVAHYAKSAPKLSAWLEENLPQGLTVFALPVAHQPTTAHHQRAGTGQSGTQTPHPRRPRLPQ